jgi:NAD(P)-dependent dehydrogenase (short-subunit alcohol dehydrogenase family)
MIYLSFQINFYMYNQPMLKENSLQGRTIVVTGGGTGLGYSMTKYFLELGANVVISSRKIDVLKESAKTLAEATGNSNIHCVACDVRKYEDIEAMLQSSIQKFGKVDGLVNNAAGNFISPTERLSNRAFDTVVDIVLKGTYNCSLALGKYWIENKIPASVLSIVTTYAWTGSGYVVPSACAKAGVLALTRSLAVEWAKYKIRFNAIAPGPFPTPGAWERLFPPALAETDLGKKLSPEHRVPVGRVGEHQELANLAAYLMSDFSSYVNGEVITIDGGEWIKGAGEFNDLNELPNQMWDFLEQMRKKQ